jgi:hypothetical protein
VIIEDDLRHYLAARYQADGITRRDPAADQAVHHPARLRSL